MIRFESQAYLKAESSIDLATMEPHKFYFEPNKDNQLSWKLISGSLEPGDLDYEIINVDSELITTGTATLSDSIHVQATVNLSAGYYIIKFSNLDIQFGLAVLDYLDPKLKPDRFFALHADLCHDDWLTYLSEEEKVTRHENLFKTLYKTGIRKIRDRIRPIQFAPQSDQWSWQGTTYRYEDTRILFNQYDIDVLGYFALSPAWMKRPGDIIPGTNRDENKYPSDLHAFTETYLKIYERWENELEVIEIWNEPIGVTEDRLAPMIHAMAHEFKSEGHDVTIAGSAFAGLHDRLVTSVGEMGCWDAIDLLTFHTYASPDQMEGRTNFYAGHANRFGQNYLPISITECGQKYIGGLWPTLAEEVYRTERIIGNAIESRAAGIESFYAFFFRAAQFIEGDNVTQHSLVDIYGTPYLTMAAYANAVIQLSHKKFLGEFKLDHPDLLRARVFGDGTTATVVFATSSDAYIKTDVAASNIFGMDGRKFNPTENGEIPLTDPIVYAEFNQADIENLIDTTVSIMDLYRRAQKKDSLPPRKTYPVVLQHFADYDHLEYGSSGYNMATILEGNVPLLFQASNFTDQDQQIEVQLELPRWLKAIADTVQSVTVPANGTKNIAWYIKLDESNSGFTGDIELRSTATENDLVSPVKFGVVCPREVPEVLNSFTSYRKMDIYDPTKWKTYGTKGSDLNISVDQDKVSFGLEVPERKSWTDAKYDISNYDLTKFKGLLVVAREDKMPDYISEFWPKITFGVEEENESKYRGTSIPADGKVHWSYLEFNDLPLDVRDDNQTLDLDKIEEFTMHTWHGRPGMKVNFEIYDVYMVSDSMLFDDSDFALNLRFRDKYSGEYVDNVNVLFDSGTYISNDTGTVTIDSIQYGFHDLEIKADGYFSLAISNIEIMQDTTLIIEMDKDLPDLNLQIIDKSDSAAVYRAIVYANDQTSFSNAEGTVDFENIPDNTVVLKIEHNDYFSYTDTIKISKNAHLSIPLTARNADVSFHIADFSGDVKNATVSLSSLTAETDENGYLIFYNQPARQEYDFSVEADGYNLFEDSFFLKTDTTIDLSLIVSTIKKNMQEENRINLYPNPVKNVLTLNCAFEKATIYLIDPGGKIVLQNEMKDFVKEIYMGGLENGVYVLKIQTENASFYQRVIY